MRMLSEATCSLSYLLGFVILVWAVFMEITQ